MIVPYSHGNGWPQRSSGIHAAACGRKLEVNYDLINNLSQARQKISAFMNNVFDQIILIENEVYFKKSRFANV